MSGQEAHNAGEMIEISDGWWNKLNSMPFISCKCQLSVLFILMSCFLSAEHKGKTLHLLKQASKPVPQGRKRFKHNIYDPASAALQVLVPLGN